jgi:hypothetical protein
MASNHSFIQGGVSTLPSSFQGIKKAPWRGSMYEQAIVIILIDNQSFFFLSKLTNVSGDFGGYKGFHASYYIKPHIFNLSVSNKVSHLISPKI